MDTPKAKLLSAWIRVDFMRHPSICHHVALDWERTRLMNEGSRSARISGYVHALEVLVGR